jgi:hypothetical protein
VGLSGRVPHRVDAATKAALLDLLVDAVEQGQTWRSACRVLELPERRAQRWLVRRVRGQLVDRSPGGSPMHGILAEEAAEPDWKPPDSTDLPGAEPSQKIDPTKDPAMLGNPTPKCDIKSETHHNRGCMKPGTLQWGQSDRHNRTPACRNWGQIRLTRPPNPAPQPRQLRGWPRALLMPSNTASVSRRLR